MRLCCRGQLVLRPPRGAGELLPYVESSGDRDQAESGCGDIALPRRSLHRAQDPIVRAATAEMALERVADLGIGRSGVLRQQRRRRDDHPARAVAALERLLGDERGLHRVRLLGVPSPATVVIERRRRGSTSAARRSEPARRRSAPCRRRTARARTRTSDRTPRRRCAGRAGAASRDRPRPRPAGRRPGARIACFDNIAWRPRTDALGSDRCRHPAISNDSGPTPGTGSTRAGAALDRQRVHRDHALRPHQVRGRQSERLSARRSPAAHVVAAALALRVHSPHLLRRPRRPPDAGRHARRPRSARHLRPLRAADRARRGHPRGAGRRRAADARSRRGGRQDRRRAPPGPACGAGSATSPSCRGALIDRLRHYFTTYKALPGKANVVSIGEAYGREHAETVIRAAIADYAESFAGATGTAAE